MFHSKDNLTHSSTPATALTDADFDTLNAIRAEAAGSLLEAETLIQEVITLLDVGLCSTSAKIGQILDRTRRVLAEGSEVTEGLDEDLENILPDTLPTLLARPLSQDADRERAELECIEAKRRLDQVQTELRRLQGNRKHLNSAALKGRLAQLSAEMFDIPLRFVAPQHSMMAQGVNLCQEAAQ